MSDVFTTRELRFERMLDAPVDTVWRYLTDPALRARWFMGGPIDPHAGGRIGFTMDHGTLSDGDVATPERYRPYIGTSWTEEITRFEPPHVLAFRWNGGDGGEVTFTLTADGERTLLVLVHAGLRGRDDAVNFGGGWHSHLAVLEARLSGRGVADFWTLHAEAERTVAAALA